MRERCQRQRQPIGEAAARLVARRAKQGPSVVSHLIPPRWAGSLSSASICFQN